VNKRIIIIDGVPYGTCCICREIIDRKRRSCIKCRPIVQKIYSMMNALKKRAKLKDLEVSVTIDDLFTLYIEYCPVFGIRLNWNNRKPQNDSPSLDRIDINKGYIRGNVAIVSMRANRVKDNATIEELEIVLDWMKRKLNKNKVL